MGGAELFVDGSDFDPNPNSNKIKLDELTEGLGTFDVPPLDGKFESNNFSPLSISATI